MTEKKDFRIPNDIWRLIGLALILAAILIPHGSGVLIAFGKNDHWFLPENLTGSGVLVVVGVILALYPMVMKIIARRKQ